MVTINMKIASRINVCNYYYIYGVGEGARGQCWSWVTLMILAAEGTDALEEVEGFNGDGVRTVQLSIKEKVKLI